MKKYKEMTNRKTTLVQYFYVGAMLLFYFSYILLDNYRLHQSEKWKSTNNLTLEDVQTIQQLASLNAVFEWLFIVLFIIGALFFLYKKNREKLVQFIILNVCFFAALFLISYISSFFLRSPIGNLTQPLFPTAFLLVLLMVYSFLISLNKRLRKSI
ncbi:hypothetical protein [Solibacillus sp. CAU 1738]|uniref:hypothetical protein n=1 Tax=Solibacillus sp. CAU 1738 TaxID=3140363 RepID=UPI00325FFF77